MVSGLSLLMGYAGQVSLGQAPSSPLAPTRRRCWPRTWASRGLALIVAPVASATIAYVVGLPLLRLRGHYLAFGTLGVSIDHHLRARRCQRVDRRRHWPDQASHRLGIGPLTAEGPFKPIVFAYLAWGLALLALLFNNHLVHSRSGRALRALATSEAGALASGVAVGRYKLQVFALSAAYAGLAGGVYAFFVSFIAPGSFPLVLSIEFLIMATVGGLGSVWGQ